MMVRANRDGSGISVVLALYNGRAHIEEALRTVIGQTILPGEVIVVDDGSTDGSHEVVEGIETPFSVKVVRQANMGQSAARNVGVGLANGEFIAFLDQDDQWRPGHLDALLKAITRSPDVAWAYTDFDEMDTEGKIVTHCFIQESGLVQPKRSLTSCLSGDLMVIPSASLLRKTALDQVGGFDERLSGYEDDDLFIRIFRAGWKHVFVAKALTRFRVHGASSSSGWKFLDSRIIYLEKLVETISDDDRLNRYWVRDLVLPRFFVATLDDYSRALSCCNWEQAAQASAAAERLAGMMQPRFRRQIEVRLMGRPRLCRRALQVLDVMPSSAQRLVNPTLRLRKHSRYAD
jgi:glycosyltransferase involved in cell wall biosynthesis